MNLYTIRPLVWVGHENRDGWAYAHTVHGRCEVRTHTKLGWVVVGPWQAEHHHQSRESAVSMVERWHTETLLTFLTLHGEQPREGEVPK